MSMKRHFSQHSVHSHQRSSSSNLVRSNSSIQQLKPTGSSSIQLGKPSTRTNTNGISASQQLADYHRRASQRTSFLQTPSKKKDINVLGTVAGLLPVPIPALPVPVPVPALPSLPVSIPALPLAVPSIPSLPVAVPSVPAPSIPSLPVSVPTTPSVPSLPLPPLSVPSIPLAVPSLSTVPSLSAVTAFTPLLSTAVSLGRSGIRTKAASLSDVKLSLGKLDTKSVDAGAEVPIPEGKTFTDAVVDQLSNELKDIPLLSAQNLSTLVSSITSLFSKLSMENLQELLLHTIAQTNQVSVLKGVHNAERLYTFSTVKSIVDQSHKFAGIPVGTAIAVYCAHVLPQIYDTIYKSVQSGKITLKKYREEKQENAKKNSEIMLAHKKKLQEKQVKEEKEAKEKKEKEEKATAAGKPTTGKPTTGNPKDGATNPIDTTKKGGFFSCCSATEDN